MKKHMNPLRTAASIAFIAFAAFTFIAPAAAQTDTRPAPGTFWVDTTGDGVADSRPTRGTGAGRNAGENFVDANGDGNCDNFVGREALRKERRSERAALGARNADRARGNSESSGGGGPRR